MSTPAVPTSAPSAFVTVLGWLGIILFGSGLALAVLQILLFRTLFGHGVAWPSTAVSPWAPPSPEAMRQSLVFLRYAVIGLCTLMAAGLVASIGLLHRKNWARLTTLGFLYLSIAWAGVSLLGLVATAGVPIPSPAAGPPSVAMDEMMKMMRIVFSVLAVVNAVVSGWLVKRLMSRPIRDEFRGGMA